MLFLNLEFVKLEVPIVTVADKICRSLFYLGKIQHYIRQISMPSVRVGSEELNLNFSLNIVFAEISGSYLDLVPSE